MGIRRTDGLTWVTEGQKLFVFQEDNDNGPKWYLCKELTQGGTRGGRG